MATASVKEVKEGEAAREMPAGVGVRPKQGGPVQALKARARALTYEEGARLLSPSEHETTRRGEGETRPEAGPANLP